MLFRTALGTTLFAAALAAQPAGWVKKSNENARVLLEAMARTAPESAASYGVEGIDDKIIDFAPGHLERNRTILTEARDELKKRLAAEDDLHVRQDLEIMIDSTDLDLEAGRLTEKLTVPYIDVTRFVFGSLRDLLDDQVAAERRPAALVRLRRYAGLEDGYEPFAKLATAEIREALGKNLQPPFRGRVEKSLSDSPYVMKGIEPLFQKYGISGYEETLAAFEKQVAEYDAFVREELLPKCSEDYRLPPEIYAVSLRAIGIDIPPGDLANQAHGAFREIQLEMREIAARIAKERGLPSTDYRDVIRELKKKQLVGDRILPHYFARLKQIEDIVRREDLVTLPDRAAKIRLASEAESAASPAPHMSPPRLVGNTGEQGEFVLPLRVPDEHGEMQGFDDFTFEAASWTLTAHEARPGHEMQFAKMIEAGVSTARAIFAFNSTNVEGWALYTESFMKPYMPPEGQLISLQHRLLRAARAYLDPELQAGTITPEEAMRVLTEDVVFSEPMARQEVERYTFRMPGQACSYFYGYSRMIALRDEVQKAMGVKFDIKRFHDFVLAQGLLPPSLLRKTVLDEFVGE